MASNHTGGALLVADRRTIAIAYRRRIPRDSLIDMLWLPRPPPGKAHHCCPFVGFRASGNGSFVPGTAPRGQRPVGGQSRPLSKRAALSGHHRSPDAASRRQRPIRLWLHQRAVKLPDPSLLLVGPPHRSGRTQDPLVPIALVPRQRFRAPMPRYDARPDRDRRTYASSSSRAHRDSVATFAESS